MRWKLSLKSERVEKVDAAISGSYDDFRKVLTFSYDVSALVAESFYVIKIWEVGKIKLLSQDKMYIIPTGSSVATYQPKLWLLQRRLWITSLRFMESNFKFVQLSSYTTPVVSENARKGWVEYGDDNDYFQYSD